MYSNLGIQRYHEANINSITREKMIVLLYEKIINDLSQASGAIKQNNRVEMNKKVNHSVRIVTELRNALDHSIGGDISRNLESLYDFLFTEQLELLVDQDAVHVDNCIQVLQPLLEAWQSIPTGTDYPAGPDAGRVSPSRPHRNRPSRSTTSDPEERSRVRG